MGRQAGQVPLAGALSARALGSLAGDASASSMRPPQVNIRYPSGREDTFPVPLDAASILDAGLDAGVAMPYSCCAGICTSCKAHVVSGAVTHNEQDVLTPEELQDGYILCCQAKPATAVVTIRYVP